MQNVTRPQWRDAVKEDQNLTEHEVIIGLLIADYWKTDSVQPLWAAAEVLMRQSRLSRTMVFRAAKGLRLKGYLNEVEKARHGRSPRWLPTIPEPEQCLEDTNQCVQDTNQCPEDHRDLKNSTPTPYLASSDAAPTRRAAPTPSSPTKKRMTRTEDIALWHETLETQHTDCSKAELIEIYDHWNTRYNWPGCFARDMQEKGNLDGFLGGAGIDLGLYDEADVDPWDTTKSA